MLIISVLLDDVIVRSEFTRFELADSYIFSELNV